MITNLFLNVIAISVSTSLIIIFLLIFAPLLNKRYAIKWKYLMWVVIAVRLIIPFHMDISVPRIVIDVPAEITAPINIGNESDAPSAPLTGHGPIEVNHENAVLPTPQTESKHVKLTLLDMIAYLWLTGCLLFLSVHIFSFLHYKRRITQNGKAVKERYILQQVDRLSKKLQIKTRIRVMRYEDAESPMVIGFLKPMLVLPDCVYIEEELFFILKHELIHIKRHDIYFKFLFVIANALHWFNPIVYIMQREAVVDMELSCDEKVIQQTAYAVRKAYTETLLSTFSKQHKKGNFLTTQFYGGKKIMKKRFKNILTRSPKKNGLFVCICTICITLISGMMIGCSAIKSDSPKGTVQAGSDTTNPDLADHGGTQADDADTQADNAGTQTGDAGTQAGDAGAQAGNTGTQADAAGDGSTDMPGDTQNGNTGNSEEQPSTSGENSYKSVLLGESGFICTDLANKSLNISEIKQVVSDEDGVTASVTKFAVVDLDGDGETEVVLWIYVNGGNDYGYEILDYQNGEIYGYTLWYRAFMDLKTDGTFFFSGGAADSGVGKMIFSETGYRVSGLAYSQSEYDSDNELIIQYFANGESCSEEEFHDAINDQEQKADVEWYDLSENNINAVL